MGRGCEIIVNAYNGNFDLILPFDAALLFLISWLYSVILSPLRDILSSFRRVDDRIKDIFIIAVWSAEHYCQATCDTRGG